MKYSPEIAIRYSQEREKFNETDKIFLEALESIGVKGKVIIDLGCGDGRHARRIKEMGAAHVTGVDINQKMIELAHEKTSGTPDIEFMVADGRKLPLESNSSDIVVSNFVVHYFEDAEEIFTEIARVLKEGGYFVGIFNLTDVESGFENLYNQHMPIRLGHGEGSIVVQNLIKSRQEIEQAIAGASLTLQQEQELDHPNATVDEAYPYKQNIKKRAVMMVLQKRSVPTI